MEILFILGVGFFVISIASVVAYSLALPHLIINDLVKSVIKSNEDCQKTETK